MTVTVVTDWNCCRLKIKQRGRITSCVLDNCSKNYFYSKKNVGNNYKNHNILIHNLSKYINLVTIVVSKLVKLLNWRKGGNVINHFSIVIVLSVVTEHCGKKNYVNWILNTRDLEMDIE